MPTQSSKNGRRPSISRFRRLIVGPTVLAALGALALAISAYASGNTTANLVLGQVDFTHNGANIVDGRGLNAPAAVVIDHSVTPNRIYVADYSNNRVLGWSSDANFANGKAADLVIGQPRLSISGV